MDEINAHLAEKTLSNKNILERLVADEKKPTLKEKILNFFNGAKTDYAEDAKLSKAAEKLYKQYKTLFDEFSEKNYQNNAVDETERFTVDEDGNKHYLLEQWQKDAEAKAAQTNEQNNERLAIANDEQNDYNSQQGDKNNGRTDETNGRNQERSGRRNSVYIQERQSISILLNNGRVRDLREVVADEKTAQRIEADFEAIYSEPHTETQENLLWHAKNEDITLYFAKLKDNAQEAHIYYRENLFISDTASEQMLVDILNIVKPIKRTISANKIAHISEERWTKFLSRYPNAYLTQVPIQQFLDMTTESYVDQRQINARSSKISKNATIDDIRKNSGEDIYLKIDLKNNAVIDHEGRHRMTALLNNGNSKADIFVILDNSANADLYENLKIKGQFNSNKYTIISK